MATKPIQDIEPVVQLSLYGRISKGVRVSKDTGWRQALCFIQLHH